MDVADFMVFGLSGAVFAFLVWIEIKSRRNSATVQPVAISADTGEEAKASASNAVKEKVAAVR